MTFIGVGGNSGSDESEYASFVNSTGVDGLTHVFDPDGDVWRSYGIGYQPAWAFINDDGSVETVASSLGKDRIIEKANELKSR